MNRLAFMPGTMIRLGGRSARIICAADPQNAEVLYATGESERVDLFARSAAGEVRADNDAASSGPTERDTSQYTDKEWAEGRRREAIVAPLLAGGDVSTRVAEAARTSGVTARTIYRWMHHFERGGLRALVPDHRRRGGAGKPRVSKDRETLLAEVLSRVYLKRPGPTIKHTYEQVQLAFSERKLTAPAFSTVRRRILALDAPTVTKAHEGGARSRNKHMVSRGSCPVPPSPLHTIQIDHTPLDLHIVDSGDRSRVIGRPFLTLAVDAMTRMVVGYYLSLDPPSYLSVVMVLLQGVMPKDDLLAKHGIDTPWPVCGLPSVIYTDNGKEFRSKHLERFAEDYQIELHFRPVKDPHFGGLIERLVGTINRYTHALEGTARSSIRERGDYDAEKHAYLTLEEVDAFLVRRIVEHYHTEIHSSLGKPPIVAWQEAAKARKVPAAMPEDREKFRIDLLPYEERTIQKDGISLFDLMYTDGALRSLRGREPHGKKPAKHVVKYDPRDLSRVYVVPPDGGAVIAVPINDRSAGPFSLLELRRSKALAKAEKRAWSSRDLCGMLARERKALGEAAEKTKSAKRTAARVANQKASLGAAPTPVPLALPAAKPPTEVLIATIDDEEWGAPTIRYRRGP